MFYVCHAVLSVNSSLVVTCWERDNLLALLNVMFSYVFVTFPCGVLGHVWVWILSIPDIFLLPFTTRYADFHMISMLYSTFTTFNYLFELFTKIVFSKSSFIFIN